MKKILVFIILFLAVGFAAVSTTLYLNGTINVATHENDFDIYFSDAYLDGIKNKSLISENKKTINFETKDLIKIGDKSILEYEVTNASTQYDANVYISCVPNETDIYKVTNIMDREIIEARSVGNGVVTIELKKNVLEEQNINFTCTIEASAGERESADLGPIKGKCDYPIGNVWTFNYTGKEETFDVLCDGIYKVEVSGAVGKGINSQGATRGGGLGTTVVGHMELEEQQSLYINVGGAASGSTGGYNGGGHGNAGSGGGGGSSDIRFKGNSINDRIIVGGGGGGGPYFSSRSKYDIETLEYGNYVGTLSGLFQGDSGKRYNYSGGYFTSGGSGGGYYGGYSSVQLLNGRDQATRQACGSSYIDTNYFFNYNDQTKSPITYTGTNGRSDFSSSNVIYYTNGGNGYVKITLVDLN